MPPPSPPNKVVAYGESLIMAAAVGNTLRARVLLKRCPRARYYQDEYGRNALHMAVECGELRAVRLLQNPVAVHQRDRVDLTPLHLAILFDEQAIFHYLIDETEATRDVRAKDARQRTPLHMAVETGNLSVFVRLMFSAAKLDLFEPDVRGEIPLRTAWRVDAATPDASTRFIRRVLEGLTGYRWLYWPLARTPREVYAWGLCNAPPRIKSGGWLLTLAA